MVSGSKSYSYYLWNAYYVPVMLVTLHKLSNAILYILAYFSIHPICRGYKPKPIPLSTQQNLLHLQQGFKKILNFLFQKPL